MRGACVAGWSFLLVGLLVPAPLLGQPAASSNPWDHGTTLTVAGGIASASSDIGAHVSTSMGWEVTPRIAIEGAGFWLDRHDGAHAFAATLSLQAALSAPGMATPFVQAGFGLYRASFDLARSAIPDFYRDRSPAGPPGTGTDVFTDPAIVAGAGVSVFVTTHVAIRPELAVLVVMRNSQAYPVTTAAVRAVYHFEQHPTGSRRVGR